MPTSSHLHNELQIRDGRINALESTSSHLHHELQVRDGRINALESAVEQLRTQLNIFQEQMRTQQMAAVNRMTTPTDIELAFQEGCTSSPDDDVGTFVMSLNTMLETRVASRFGISVWYWSVFSRYFTNRYRRKTQSGCFGIIHLAGTPFFPSK